MMTVSHYLRFRNRRPQLHAGQQKRSDLRTALGFELLEPRCLLAVSSIDPAGSDWGLVKSWGGGSIGTLGTPAPLISPAPATPSGMLAPLMPLTSVLPMSGGTIVDLTNSAARDALIVPDENSSVVVPQKVGRIVPAAPLAPSFVAAGDPFTPQASRSDISKIYDADGHLVSVTKNVYDDNLLVSIITWNFNTDQSLKSVIEHDNNDDDSTSDFEWDYNPDGTIATITQANDLQTDSPEEFTWIFVNGSLSYVKDSFQGFSSWGGGEWVINADGSMDVYSWAYSYDDVLNSYHHEHESTDGSTDTLFHWIYLPHHLERIIVKDVQAGHLLTFYDYDWVYNSSNGSLQPRHDREDHEDGSSYFVSWVYDLDGNLTEITKSQTERRDQVDRSNSVSTWSYDSEGSLTSVEVKERTFDDPFFWTDFLWSFRSDGSLSDETITQHFEEADGSSSTDFVWHFDSDGSLSNERVSEHVVHDDRSTTDVYWNYDADRSLIIATEERLKTDGSGMAFSWSYFPNGSVGSASESYWSSDGSSESFHWSYRENGALADVSETHRAFVLGDILSLSWSYREDGSLAEASDYHRNADGSRTSTSWSYREDGTLYVFQLIYDSAGAPIYNYSWARHPDGTIDTNSPNLPIPIPPLVNRISPVNRTGPPPPDTLLPSPDEPLPVEPTPHTVPDTIVAPALFDVPTSSSPGTPTDELLNDLEVPVPPTAPEFGPNLAAGKNDDGTPLTFVWNSVEDNGGFTFTYQVDNPLDQPIPDTTINFYWDTNEEPVYSFTIDDIGMDDDGVLLKGEGIHTIHVTNNQLLPAFRSLPAIDRNRNLVMEIDPGDNVSELSEDDNIGQLQFAPLVVNIATHGWNDTGTNWESYAAMLDSELPEPGSILDHRVATYVSNWDSNTGFTSAFAVLAAAKVCEINGLLNAANVLKREAAVLSLQSASLAVAASRTIVSDVERQYLLPANQSNTLQKIQLFGHSRGAAVNAFVTKFLQEDGYNNIVDFVSLDGYSTDWPNDAGLIADADIAGVAVVGPGGDKLNYRVQQGLAEYAAQFLPQWLAEKIGVITVGGSDIPIVMSTLEPALTGFRAPTRKGFGFDEDVTVNGGNSPSNHLNIPSLYFVLDPPTYLKDTYEAKNANAGLATSAEASSLTISHTSDFLFQGAEVLEGMNPLRSGTAAFGFADGCFDQLGQVLSQAAEAVQITTGDLFLDYVIQVAADAAKLLGEAWQVSGDAKLVNQGGDYAAELVSSPSVTSISQFVALPTHASNIEFDLGLVAASPGDVLHILFNGANLRDISLADLAPTNHVTVALPANSLTTDGEFTFQLSGIFSVTKITLDNFAIGSGNRSPILVPEGLTLPTIPVSAVGTNNLGAAVVDLTRGISDPDDDKLGIAVVGADVEHGAMQYSLDGGYSWIDVGPVSTSNALLLAANGLTRVRFVPNEVFQGPVLTFCAWDRTTGIAGLSGDYFDATQTDGTTAFSTALDSLAITVVLSGDYDASQVVDAADYVTWRHSLGASGLAPYTGADGNGDGVVNQNDYVAWRENFGHASATTSPTLAGDYNLNGVVDSADYIVWRNTLGASGLVPYTSADGDGNGTVDQNDYAVWRAHFGQTLSPTGAGSGMGSATASAAPVAPAHEPLLVAETSSGFAVGEPNQTLDHLETSGAKQRPNQRESLVFDFAPAFLFSTPSRQTVHWSSGAQQTMGVSRYDEALAAWLASHPNSKEQVDYLDPDETWTIEDVRDPDGLRVDTVEQVFEQLASN